MKHSYLTNYLARLSQTAPPAVRSVQETINQFLPNYLEPFSYQEHVTGLLLGEVQSGKTGQMFGIIAAAADVGFDLFLVLTTDNNTLQTQTYERALDSLDGFNICSEEDEIRFQRINMRQPTIVVLKKNAARLRKWKDTLASTGFAKTRPLFIVDDEADAASLNTKVNEDNERSTINKHLEEMQKLATSSFYLQVTATPQPLLLQTVASNWRPSFVHTFEPGPGYLGGSFFYSKPKAFTTIFTQDNELSLLIKTDQTPEGLKLAAETYLVTAAHMLSTKSSKVCNFLVHPSIRIVHHGIIAGKTAAYFEHIFVNLDSSEMQQRLRSAWDNLKQSKPEIIDFRDVLTCLKQQKRVNIIILNSGESGDPNAEYHEGLNAVIGGNTLGRGVTFKGLQTVYYCRSSKTPQADTFWQHSRMFGYDRDPRLMRIFMPMPLYNLFSEINNSNEVLFKQIRENGFENIHLVLPPGVRPTRLNVVDRGLLNALVGNKNYFPPEPDQTNVEIMDSMLAKYSEDIKMYDINFQTAASILKSLTDDEGNEWKIGAFISALQSVAAEKGNEDVVKLIVRRHRDIGRKTGTLLSQDDRNLGAAHDLVPVITLYRLTGSQDKDWKGKPFWVPNIKLPKGKVFYRTENE